MTVPGGFSTLQNEHPSTGPFSLESMARQIAHGYRAFGPYAGPGPHGAGNEGLDLKPEFRRLLAAHQVLWGHRQVGQLLSLPPPDLPPIAPYDTVFGAGAFASGPTT